VTTDDDALADRLRLLRNYGSRQKYKHEAVGVNSRLEEIQAAFLRERLRCLDADNQHRASVARRYFAALADVPGLTLPLADDADTSSAWHLFAVRHAQRQALADALAASGVETLVHYPTAVHRQAAYADTPAAACELPRALAWADEELSLPIGPTLDASAVDAVIAAVRHACATLSGQR
jgi:dTDP-3-amino-3,4,6-trideoxy-alpha-D-glucose transaminase